MAISYNMAEVRELLRQALMADDLEALCFDHFHAVADSFTDGMSRFQRIQRLVEHCEKHVEMEQLLDQVRKINPARYAEYAPRLQDHGRQPVNGVHLSPAALAAMEATYRQRISEQFETLTFKGISPSGRPIALPLESIYVDLKTVAEVPEAADTFSADERRATPHPGSKGRLRVRSLRRDVPDADGNNDPRPGTLSADLP